MAIIKKLITAVIKLPYFSTGEFLLVPKVICKSEKSTPPNIPKTGEIISVFKDVTTAVNALSTITPTTYP